MNISISVQEIKFTVKTKMSVKGSRKKTAHISASIRKGKTEVWGISHGRNSWSGPSFLTEDEIAIAKHVAGAAATIISAALRSRKITGS